MRWPTVIAVLVVSVVVASCSPSDNDPSHTFSPDPLISELTLAGTSLLGTFTAPCTTVANYANASGKTTVGITAGSGSLIAPGAAGAALRRTPFTFDASLVVTGPVSTGTYTSGTTSGFTGSITITNAGVPTWSAASGTANQTFTLTITKVVVLTSTANGTAYTVDGTLDATVPAVTSSGATGTVTVHANFVNN